MVFHIVEDKAWSRPDSVISNTESSSGDWLAA
jgi:hypothetical protein